MNTPCHEFTGYLDRNGYGQQSYKGKPEYAHRVAYCEYNGVTLAEISGIVVRHRCDNPACIRGDHLELGTQADNMADMRKRGRQSRGSTRPQSKLTDSAVIDILARWVARDPLNGTTALAIEYGVSKSVLSSIVNGKAWTHLSKPGVDRFPNV